MLFASEGGVDPPEFIREGIASFPLCIHTWHLCCLFLTASSKFMDSKCRENDLVVRVGRGRRGIKGNLSHNNQLMYPSSLNKATIFSSDLGR